MKYESYTDLSITDDFSIINFVSAGKKGVIQKRIAFTETEVENLFNLAFGDLDVNGEINDNIVSDNGDRNKILATIVTMVDGYTAKYPDRWIVFKGSTKERTRLYRMAVGLNLKELSMKFEIYGITDKGLVLFCKDLEINAFLIKRKIV